MRRIAITGVILAIGGLCIVAAQAPTGPKVVKVEKLKDNLFVLKGGGGNTAVFIGTNGVVVIDTKYPDWGRPILDKVKELTSKPVTMVINTHAHRDHSSGNVEFPANVEFVAHENSKANMERLEDPDYSGFVRVAGSQPQPTKNIFKANGGKGIPTKTFKDRMTLGSGSDRIELYYFGRGHTDGDAWIVIPALRAMHSGDIFSRKGLPSADNNGGHALEIVDTLRKAADTIKDVDVIVPGHSEQMMTLNDLKDYADFNRDFVAAVRAAKQAGKSVDEIASTWKIPARYTGYDVPPDRVKRSAEAIFDRLK